MPPLEKHGDPRYTIQVPRISAPQFAIELARLAHDNKSEDVTVLDLRGVSHVMDFVVICTGTSDRQIRAVADRVAEYARKIGEQALGLCGYDSATWIVVDYVDVVFHVFARPYREYYDLELLWGDAPRLDWARSESA
jgi:ribosome-associated protein